MNKPLSLLSRIFAIGILSLAAGCMSTVTVTADEPGALIRYRGKGRPSYRWRTAGLVRGPDKPCVFKAHYSTISLYGVWDEGTPKERRSEVVDLPLSNWSDPDTVHLHSPKRR